MNFLKNYTLKDVPAIIIIVLEKNLGDYL